MKLDVKFAESNQSFNPQFGEVNNISDGGYERGYAAGYEEGNAEGYPRGHADGVEQGYADGVDDFVTGAIVHYKNNEITTIPYGAFAYKPNLQSVECANATQIGELAFSNNTKLTAVTAPLVTRIARYAFVDCSALSEVNCPLLKNLDDTTFARTALVRADFPNATGHVANYTFSGCSKLEYVNIGQITSIGHSTFANCKSLKAVVIRTDKVASLNFTAAFTGCVHIYGTVDTTYNPKGDKDGYIYVPAALVDSYKAATNWSTIASQIRAIEDYPDVCGGDS